jgi:uncharacterized membrane protein YebE (DUF533 family)
MWAVRSAACSGTGSVPMLGGISLKSKTADVVLTLTDVRSTEQLALEEGHAKKTDLGWMGGGGLGFMGGFAAAGASSYSNTEIGQVVAMAYLDAYTKLVNDVKNQAPDAKADNVQQAVTMSKPSKLYTSPDLKSKVVRDLDPRHAALSDRRQTGRVVESQRRTRQ